MNKMVPCTIVGPIAAALVERVYDIVTVQDSRRDERRSAPRRAETCTKGEEKVEENRGTSDRFP